GHAHAADLRDRWPPDREPDRQRHPHRLFRQEVRPRRADTDSFLNPPTHIRSKRTWHIRGYESSTPATPTPSKRSATTFARQWSRAARWSSYAARSARTWTRPKSSASAT